MGRHESLGLRAHSSEAVPVYLTPPVILDQSVTKRFGMQLVHRLVAELTTPSLARRRMQLLAGCNREKYLVASAGGATGRSSRFAILAETLSKDFRLTVRYCTGDVTDCVRWWSKNLKGAQRVTYA